MREENSRSSEMSKQSLEKDEKQKKLESNV